MTKQNQQSRHVVHRLVPGDDAQFDMALDLFELAFEDPENYGVARPSSGYRNRILSKEGFIFFVALADHKTVGALAAYELQKFEQERSEFYIYDLAVSPEWRHHGIATDLIEHLKSLAAKKHGAIVFIQAAYGDEPAIALYTKLGTREHVVHFDIKVTP